MDNGILTFGCNVMDDFYALVVHSKKITSDVISLDIVSFLVLVFYMMNF